MPLTTNTLVIVLLVLMLVITVDAFLLRLKIRKVLRGKTGGSIDDSLASMDKDIKTLAHFQKEAEGYFQNVEKRLRRSVQGLHTVRFNAFKGTGEGGNQSFASALIDENGDGLVVSSMYSRDRVSVFSKPVAHFASPYELSDEENEALEKAKDKVGA